MNSLTPTSRQDFSSSISCPPAYNTSLDRKWPQLSESKRSALNSICMAVTTSYKTIDRKIVRENEEKLPRPADRHPDGLGSWATTWFYAKSSQLSIGAISIAWYQLSRRLDLSDRDEVDFFLRNDLKLSRRHEPCLNRMNRRHPPI